jgi:hypothetical protein
VLIWPDAFRSNRMGRSTSLVIGFGIVSVPLTNAPNTRVTKTQAIGLIVSDQPGIKVGLGYSSSTVVQIVHQSKYPGRGL